METPAAFAPKVPSGIEVLDEAWKGLYHGGSYLFYGWARSGRDLLTLQALQAASDLGERALFISPRRPKDLVIQAASIGFNLRAAYERQTVKLMRIPPTLNLQEMSDEGLSKALNDLVSVIWQYKPDRAVIDDFTPFVQYHSFDRFRVAFMQMMEQLDPIDMTLVLTMGEPANSYSQRVVDFIASQMTGTVHIEAAENGSTTLRKLTLLPNIGHIEGKRVEYLDLADILREPDLSGQPRMIGSGAPEPVQHKRAGLRPQLGQPTLLPSQHTDEDDVFVAPGEDEPMDAYAAYDDADDFDGMEGFDNDEAFDSSETFTDIEDATAPLYDPVPLGRKPQQDFYPSDFSFQGDSYDSFDGALDEEQDVPYPSFGESQQALDVEVPVAVNEREAFRQQLDAQFQRRAEDGTPFLLMAMRLDREGQGHTFDFSFARDLVQESLNADDALLADAEQERMVVLLPDSKTEEAQRVFTHLKARLREEAPEQADHILRAVSAIVVPDGKPFNNADEFLAYALDEA